MSTNTAQAPGQVDDMTPEREAAQVAVRRIRGRIKSLGDDGLDLLFREARTHNAWLDRPVADDDLKRIYDIIKWGPSSANGNHARFVFVRSEGEKQKLADCVHEGNKPKIMAAPVTTIIAYDTAFWEKLPRLFPHRDMTGPFRDNLGHAETTAFRNSSLIGAYFMLAARAIGLDVGAMSGFLNDKVDAAFFAGTTLKSNFLCNLGYGDERALFQRLPRFDFDEIAKII